LRLLARGEAVAGRLDEALGAAQHLLAKWPGELDAQLMASSTALDLGNSARALEVARRATSNHPAAQEAHVGLVRALIAHGEFADAAREGEDTLRAFPLAPRSTLVLTATAYALNGAVDRALDVYGRLAPTDELLAGTGRADLSLYSGQLDDAEALSRGVIARALARHDPAAARPAYRTLAQVQLRRGNEAQAAVAARTGLGDGPIELQYELASALIQSGGEKAALEATASWAQSPRSEQRAYAKLIEGDVFMRRGKPSEAAEAYAAAVGLRDLWRAHERLGQADLATGATVAAETEFVKCMDRRGEVALIVPPALQNLSAVYAGIARAREGRNDPPAGQRTLAADKLHRHAPMNANAAPSGGTAGPMAERSPGRRHVDAPPPPATTAGPPGAALPDLRK
jgi:tetratricopeptide (TPR) repeat protein